MKGGEILDDSRILALFFERSEQAITELSAKYGAACRRIAGNILASERDVEECLNDAWFAVWNTVPPQNPDPLLTYVCRVTRNQALKRRRANTAQQRNAAFDAALEEIEGVFPAAPSAEEEYDADRLALLINRFLATLDKESRILFVRRYWRADSIEDLARAFGMSRHNVSVRLSRIRKKLETYLTEEGVSL